eukprot:5258719-Pyramimonas_sp.AAC.2
MGFDVQCDSRARQRLHEDLHRAIGGAIRCSNTRCDARRVASAALRAQLSLPSRRVEVLRATTA